MSIFDYLQKHRSEKGEVWYQTELAFVLDYWYIEDKDVINKWDTNYINMINYHNLWE